MSPSLLEVQVGTARIAMEADAVADDDAGAVTLGERPGWPVIAWRVGPERHVERREASRREAQDGRQDGKLVRCRGTQLGDEAIEGRESWGADQRFNGGASRDTRRPSFGFRLASRRTLGRLAMLVVRHPAEIVRRPVVREEHAEAVRVGPARSPAVGSYGRATAEDGAGREGLATIGDAAAERAGTPTLVVAEVSYLN